MVERKGAAARAVRGWWIVVGRGAWASLLAAIVLFSGPAVAAQQGPTRVGYVDLQALESHYVAPNLQEPRAALERELIALQAEFDEKAASLSDEEKQVLFDQYQRQLDERSLEVQRLQAGLWQQVREAIAAVAAELGFDTVLQKEAVLYGGEDLTAAVLRRLGVQTVPAGGS